MPNQPDQLVHRIKELIRRRSSTDRRMGYAWMLVPILPVLAGAGLAVASIGIILSSVSKLGNLQQPSQYALSVIGEIIALYGFTILTFFLILLIGAFAIYYLIDRRNSHFRRQQQLFLSLEKYLASRVEASSSNDFALLAHLNEDSIFAEKDRPAGLWSIFYLFVTPIVGLIIAYNLTQDLRKHEELQFPFQIALANVFKEVGLTIAPSSSNQGHKRDPILFFVLTAITGGLFWVYWFYTLLKDYNQHFLDQAQFEDKILALLEPQPALRNCSSCGGTLPETARYCPNCGKEQTS